MSTHVRTGRVNALIDLAKQAEKCQIFEPDIILQEVKKSHPSFSAVSLFGVGTSSCQSPRSPVLCIFYIFTPASFVYFIITSLHPSLGKTTPD